MKRLLSIMMLTVLLGIGALIPTYATDDNQASRVIDGADLLTDSEEAALVAKLNEISSRQEVDIVVATVSSTGEYPVRDYADELYISSGFGNDGLLLLISMEKRDWYISTHGYGITAFTDSGIKYIGKQISPALSDGSYSKAFNDFATLCDDFITQARTDKPYNKSSLPREPLSIIWIPIAVIIGFVIAKIVVGNMKSKLKTVRAQKAANSYIKDGSMSLTESRDLFLYRTVTRTAKPKDNSSGSSTHTSSSGTTHGGGGGKF